MYIQLTKNKKTLVDKDDYKLLSKYKWHINGNGYAETAIYAGLRQMKKVTMHKMLLTPPLGMQIDHINGDKIDNRKSNLRICTPSENRRNCPKRKSNTSGYKGVSKASTNRWKSTIRYEGKVHLIGVFKTKEEAYAAYCTECVIRHGAFACL